MTQQMLPAISVQDFLAQRAARPNVPYLTLLVTKPLPVTASSELGHLVMDKLVWGPVHDTLSSWAGDQDLRYARILVDSQKDHLDIKAVYLPQVRLYGTGTRVLFRSAIVIGEDGQLLAQDVAGLTIRHRPSTAQRPVTRDLKVLLAYELEAIRKKAEK